MIKIDIILLLEIDNFVEEIKINNKAWVYSLFLKYFFAIKKSSNGILLFDIS